MSRQLEADLEKRFERERAEVYRAVCGGLDSGVSESGGVLQGLSAKLGEHDCLLTLRAEFPTGRMVAFIGGEDLGSCLRKAQREAAADGLRWKADRYSNGQT